MSCRPDFMSFFKFLQQSNFKQNSLATTTITKLVLILESYNTVLMESHRKVRFSQRAHDVVVAMLAPSTKLMKHTSVKSRSEHKMHALCVCFYTSADSH